MTITVKLFGIFADTLGHATLLLGPVTDLESLRIQLVSRDARFADMPYSIAVNHKIVRENIDLNLTDEIAILPPFAGG
jgi:sulfur-carrier protein